MANAKHAIEEKLAKLKLRRVLNKHLRAMHIKPLTRSEWQLVKTTPHVEGSVCWYNFRNMRWLAAVRPVVINNRPYWASITLHHKVDSDLMTGAILSIVPGMQLLGWLFALASLGPAEPRLYLWAADPSGQPEQIAAQRSDITRAYMDKPERLDRALAALERR